MNWLTITRESRRRSKAGFAETRLRTVLLNGLASGHSLSGHHGRRILEAVANRWNASGYQTSDTVTRCAGDHLSINSRRKFHLSHA